MGISNKHAYRFQYLKSEEWQTVRIEALVRFNATCFLCHHRDISNDAHHIFYEGSFWKTKAEDLVVLCRDCHDLVHAIVSIRNPKNNRDEKLIEFKNFSEQLKNWSCKVNSQRLFEDPFSDEFSRSDGVKEISRLDGKFLKPDSCYLCNSSGITVTSRPHPKFKSDLFWCDNCWNDFAIPAIDMKWSQLRPLLEARRSAVKATRAFKAWFPTI